MKKGTRLHPIGWGIMVSVLVCLLTVGITVDTVCGRDYAPAMLLLDIFVSMEAIDTCGQASRASTHTVWGRTWPAIPHFKGRE